MGRTPEILRQIIAANIRACRMDKFPGRGGGKKCAEAFGVSPQQWSPWERGMRTPDELRLSQIADFFGVTVEYMRQDNGNLDMLPRRNIQTALSPGGQPAYGDQDGLAPYQQRPGFPHCPFYHPPKPGQPFGDNVRSLCWLAERFFGDVREFGITLRLHPDDIDHVVNRCLCNKSLSQ